MRGTIESPAERQRRFFMRRHMRLLKDTGSVTGEFLKLPRGAQALLGDGMDPLVLEEVAQGMKKCTHLFVMIQYKLCIDKAFFL